MDSNTTTVIRKMRQMSLITYNFYILACVMSAFYIVMHPFGIMGFLLRITLLLIVVIAMKVITRKERPDWTDALSMPSGHSAFAFFLASMFRFNPLVTLWAVSVAASRVITKRHHVWDTVIGALIGMAFGLRS